MWDVSANHGKKTMDHDQLMDKIKTRLDETDKKIDRNNDKLDHLKDDLHEYNLKTAILETQMAGVVKVGLMILAAVIGIISFGYKKGMF